MLRKHMLGQKAEFLCEILFAATGESVDLLTRLPSKVFHSHRSWKPTCRRQVWSLAFASYQSLKTIPQDLREAAA
jgi:hypothetical protein